MSITLPRVTYSIIGVYFTPVHDYLDSLLSGQRLRSID